MESVFVEDESWLLSVYQLQWVKGHLAATQSDWLTASMSLKTLFAPLKAA